MSDTILRTPTLLQAAPWSGFHSLGRFITAGFALVREWRRRSRSRWELSAYSYDERRDLGFAAELSDEIEKPFWKK